MWAKSTLSGVKPVGSWNTQTKYWKPWASPRYQFGWMVQSNTSKGLSTLCLRRNRTTNCQKFIGVYFSGRGNFSFKGKKGKWHFLNQRSEPSPPLPTHTPIPWVPLVASEDKLSHGTVPPDIVNVSHPSTSWRQTLTCLLATCPSSDYLCGPDVFWTSQPDFTPWRCLELGLVPLYHIEWDSPFCDD